MSIWKDIKESPDENSSVYIVFKNKQFATCEFINKKFVDTGIDYDTITKDHTGYHIVKWAYNNDIIKQAMGVKR